MESIQIAQGQWELSEHLEKLFMINGIESLLDIHEGDIQGAAAVDSIITKEEEQEGLEGGVAGREEPTLLNGEELGVMVLQVLADLEVNNPKKNPGHSRDEGNGSIEFGISSSGLSLRYKAEVAPAQRGGKFMGKTGTEERSEGASQLVP